MIESVARDVSLPCVILVSVPFAGYRMAGDTGKEFVATYALWSANCLTGSWSSHSACERCFLSYLCDFAFRRRVAVLLTVIFFASSALAQPKKDPASGTTTRLENHRQRLFPGRAFHRFHWGVCIPDNRMESEVKHKQCQPPCQNDRLHSAHVNCC